MARTNKIIVFISMVLLFITMMSGFDAATGFSVAEQPSAEKDCHPLIDPPIQRVPAKTNVQKKHHQRLPAWVIARNKRRRQMRNWSKNHTRVNRGKHTYRIPK